MKKFLLLGLLLPMLSFAQMTELELRRHIQTASEEELVFLNSQMMQDNYLYQAEIVADKLISLQPDNCNYSYRKGYVALMSRNDYVMAKQYFLVAINDTEKNFDMYSAREKSAPIDAFYHLGKCYHLNEELDEAIKYYNLFLQNSASKSEMLEFAELGIAQCAIAKREIASPRSAIVKNIGSIVNTPEPEYAPVVSLDGASLYFTSRRGWEDGSTDELRDPALNQFPEDIFVSYSDFSGEWTSPEKLAFCQNKYNEATIGVSMDERRVYVYQDMSGGGDIYYSDFEKNKFVDLAALDYNEVNTKYWETHCTMTPDGLNLYFVSDRPGGFGGRDIYRLVRLPNGEWSKAQNMGPTINTPYDEDAPFIAVNNKTLYYSSNGKESMGGFDVFVTFRDEDNNWSVPANMGYPINSTGDDIYYTTTIDGLRGYLSSFRKDGFGEKDIYEIQNDYLGNRPISSLKGMFISTTGEPLPDNLEVHISCPGCDNPMDKNINPRLKNGAFFGALTRCKEYTIEFYEGDVLLSSETFSTLCNTENEEIIKNYYLGDYEMEGTVADNKTLQMLPGTKVELLDLKTNQVYTSYVTDSLGGFVSDYLTGKKYGEHINLELKVSKKGYLSQTFVLDTVLGKFKTLHLDYLLAQMEIGIDVGAVLELKPIYFDLDKSNIREDAAKELDKIVKIMNDNPNIVIELGSHTDCRASKAYNLSLSDRRAKASAAYVRARISNPKRIYGKGYGESKLVNDCGCEGDVVSDCSEEEHQANRRTEFKIVKK